MNTCALLIWAPAHTFSSDGVCAHARVRSFKSARDRIGVCVCLCAHICIFVVVARQSGWIGKGRPTNYGYGGGWEVRCVIMKVTNAVVAFVHIGQVLQ